MLSATNKGFDTCPIGFNAGGLITALRLPERYIPVMLLALGRSTQRPITRRPRLAAARSTDRQRKPTALRAVGKARFFASPTEARRVTKWQWPSVTGATRKHRKCSRARSPRCREQTRNRQRRRWPTIAREKPVSERQSHRGILFRLGRHAQVRTTIFPPALFSSIRR
jgi:choline dehydrogenase-like flavoprotein